MNLYQKLFIKMSILYLMLGASIGLLRSFVDFHPATLNFAHIHFNLLGFLVMIVSGIAYFILPRFNSVDLAFPSWQSIHFWFANIGLILLICGYGLKIESTFFMSPLIFISGAVLSAIGIFLFSINILVTLQRGEKKLKDIKIEDNKEKPQVFTLSDSPPIQQNEEISESILVIDLLDKHPEAKEYLVNEVGLVPLNYPEHLKTITENKITLGQAIQTHGKDIPSTISKLKAFLKKDIKITKDLTVGEVLNKFPSTRVIFEKYFGDGCFTCPGQSTESLEMACSIHNSDVNLLIEELNKNIS